MEQHEAYSVLITDNKGKRGTGNLFYTEGSESFYVLTCAHVIYTAQSVTVHILIPTDSGAEEQTLTANKNQFHFSPIDEAELIDDNSKHTCDIAIIECPIGDIPLQPTKYSMYPMTSGERIVAIGYPHGEETTLYYQQDELSAVVHRAQSNQDYFLIRVDDTYLNAADREAELKGFSGSPVWDEEKIKNKQYLFGGLISAGFGSNVSRGRVTVMNARLLQSLMKDEFGITIETRLPLVPDSDIAPGYEEESSDKLIVRAGWIENERRKAKTYIDTLQLKKAVDSTRAAIDNTEFSKCNIEQKYSIYAIHLEAYRLARDYDIYDSIVEEMHRASIHNDREDLAEAVRYYEAWDLDKAEEHIKKALEKNPDGNEERVLSVAIRAEIDQNADVSVLSSIIGDKDQLLFKPQSKEEEEGLYQILGYVLGKRFKETGRAIRCLNRSYQVSGNPIILETLGIAYYFHSIRDAFIEEGKDRIDPQKIYQGEIEKARDALLRVFSAADEMWLKGTFKRAGLQVFKCFYFMRDNFRIFKHYHDVMKYFEFPDKETKRDIQICYLDVAIKKEPQNFDDFDALTENDKKFFELAQLLEVPMRAFNCSITVDAPITEGELFSTLTEAEKRLQELIDTQTDDRLGFDGIHGTLINLYGNGILRYKWRAISDAERHRAVIKNPLAGESFDIYLEELQTWNIGYIGNKYRAFFEEHNDIISFEEWAHFYIRHGLFDKAKELYESVFEERQYLIKDQPEYFFRSYIDFILSHQYNLLPAIKCFVEYRNEFKDIFISMIFEMDLNFATVTFNNPDQMIEDTEILLNEGLYTQQDYDEKCLIVNMLNCRPAFAEKYAAWAKGANPLNSTFAERMLHVWKGASIEQNPHWKSMKSKPIKELVELYKNEDWHRAPQKILQECNTAENKEVVVDLWTLYLLMKDNLLGVFGAFKTVYITHNTVSMALQEINQVVDEDIKKVLIPLQIANNVKFLSPTLEQQLEVRSLDYDFMEVHSACLLAKELNCPALVGEYRFPIPESLQAKVIRPTNIDKMMSCVLGMPAIEE